jgi:beta-lactamase class A
MKYSQVILGIIVCIALEFVVYTANHKYHFFAPIFQTTLPSVSPVFYEKRSGDGQFTNPLIECVNGENDGLLNPLSISKLELTSLVNNITNSKKVETMSLYIRDLNGGPWIGVNEKEKFIGGSLLKVPILMSYMKLADQDPLLLNKKILYKEQIVSNVQYFTPSKQIEIGKTYTVEELLQYMTYYSDNNAAELLAENMGTKNFDDVFESLGFGQPDQNAPYAVDVVTYSGFFRVLFNASYVEKAYSEKALGMLSHGEFTKGLKALIPQDIVVSHKFGIRTDVNVNQLHDCGVIYYPKHPYILCVMSKGGTFDDLASAIAKVSKFVYDQVSQNK